MSESVNFGALLQSVGTLDMQPVPAGSYNAKVIDASAAQTSTGKLMYKLRYEIEDGPSRGRKVYNNITLTTDNPNALRMFFVNMKAMGLGESYFASSPSPDAVAQALMGARCIITINHREYQGVMRENVAGIKEAASPMAGLGASPAPAIPAPVAATPAPAPVVAAPVAAPAEQALEPDAPVTVFAQPQGGAPVPPPVPF